MKIDPHSGTPAASQVECPHCQRTTHQLPVDSDHVDWKLLLVVGVTALLFPTSRASRLQCEHCGELFRTKRHKTNAADRVAGGILVTFSLLLLGALAFLLVTLYAP